MKIVKESYWIIKSKYESGVYSLKKMCSFVDDGSITEKEFHYITSYSYRALKISKGW